MTTFKVYRFVSTYASWIILGALIFGGLFPSVAATVRLALIPMLVLVLTIAIMQLEWSIMHRYFQKTTLIVIQVVWLVLISPLLIVLALAVIPLPQELHLPLVLFAATSPMLCVPAVAGIYRIEMGYVLTGLLFGSLLMPLTLPVLVAVFFEQTLDISPAHLAMRLCLLIFGAMLLGLLIRQMVTPRRIKQWDAPLNASSVLFISLIGVAVMDGVGALIIDRPTIAALTVVTVCCSGLGLSLLGMMLLRSLNTEFALAVGLNSGLRNVGIILGAFGSAASVEVQLMVVAAQIALVLVPRVQGFVERRLYSGYSGVNDYANQ